jgi:NADH:ubiquinone oxidoreductase subunit F (NADH-binding)
MSGPAPADRLLRGVRNGAMLTLGEHLDVHGPLPAARRGDAGALLDAVERSGLRGRGGAHVSTAMKLRAVAGRRRRAIVVGNGAEGEPASRKDRVLLAHTPHLVLDGAVVAARAVGADEAILVVKASDRHAWRSLNRAIAERDHRDGGRPKLALAGTADGYVSGQETAVIAALNGRPAVPATVPPRPFERGVRGRPKFIGNVETLAHLALIARHGPDWFRSVGSAASPGTALVTLGGAVERPGVYEIALGSSLAELLDRAGGAVDRPRALLAGGYGAPWLDAADLGGLALGGDDPRLGPSSVGAGVLWLLGESSCGVWESARILSWLAAESAGQCGPCLYGLRAIADAFERLADGRAHTGDRARLVRWGADVTGRGACRHPDGAARLLESALRVFADEIDQHDAGRCTATHPPSMPLPIPHLEAA